MNIETQTHLTPENQERKNMTEYWHQYGKFDETAYVPYFSFNLEDLIKLIKIESNGTYYPFSDGIRFHLAKKTANNVPPHTIHEYCMVATPTKNRYGSGNPQYGGKFYDDMWNYAITSNSHPTSGFKPLDKDFLPPPGRLPLKTAIIWADKNRTADYTNNGHHLAREEDGTPTKLKSVSFVNDIDNIVFDYLKYLKNIRRDKIFIFLANLVKAPDLVRPIPGKEGDTTFIISTYEDLNNLTPAKERGAVMVNPMFIDESLEYGHACPPICNNSDCC